MKKLSTRLLALLLAALMIFAMLTACTKEEEDEGGEGGTNEVTGTEEDPGLPAKDLGGYTFTFVTNQGSSYNTGYLMYEGEEGEVLDTAIGRRNRLLEEKYNITVNQLNVSDIVTEVRTQVMGGATEFDVILASCGNLANMARENLLYNLLDIDTFNWDASYWDSNSRDELKIGSKLYFANCALNIHSIGFCVFFNKKLIADYQLDNPYELIEKNEWTLDNWSKMVTAISDDVNMDGQMDENDRYGNYIEHHNMRMFFYASGLRATTNDETGYPQITIMSDKTVNLFEKLKSVFTNTASSYCIVCQNPSFPDSFAHKYSYARYLFTQDLCLFLYMDANSVTQFAEMESEFGVLPFPKYDQNQTVHKTIYPYNNNLLAIPSVTENIEQTAFLLEDMNYISSFTVVPAWFDTLLTRRFVRDDESEANLHLLRNNCVYDLGLYYDFGGLRTTLLDVDPASSNISRNFARVEKAITAAIKKTYKDFDQFK